ncbi:fumarylacetoacetate hydrolase family protein [Lipingzhangella sp. LS1_29]|uniref:Fumarylacetoacetate hydrolase family protein n=1 Tax=Lipingzhangella rawalii TaxID=2055835 RepID=A0ABU2HB97_9ACTN|nr:fumarylacetoacetate hydrolase family protein [Lipingzhangella rawalii]MDS1272592.1 fumarylacetoacetate hydrolase family protein [Lipingzhangella rawalii]
MVHPPSQSLSVSGLRSPRAATGIGFLLEAPLFGPDPTIAALTRAVSAVMPTIDLLDSRTEEWAGPDVDAVADNARRAGVITGTPSEIPDIPDLRLAGCLLHVNGFMAATGAGGALLGSPWDAVRWLVDELCKQGLGLEAGDLVLTGSATPEVPVRAGDTISAEIAGLGAVSVPLAT